MKIKPYCFPELLKGLGILGVSSIGIGVGLPYSSAAAEKLQTVIVYGEKGERLLSETASLMHLISQDDLDSPAIEHASQLLSSVAGVLVSRGSGQEQLVAIRSPVFTGTGACGAFWLAENGIPLRGTGFCNANEFFDAHYEAAQSVEVFKGPHAAVVGGNSQYGGVNVRLGKVADIDNELALTANSLGFRKLQLRAKMEGVQHGFAVWATGIEDDSFRSESGFKQQKISLRHEWENSTWVSVENGLTLMHLEQETAGYIEGKDAYRDKSQSRGNIFPEAYRDADAMRLYSRWRWRNLDSEWTLTPYARTNKMDFLMHFVPWQPTEYNEHDSLGWHLQWQRYLMRGTKVYWTQEFEQTWADLREFQHGISPIIPNQIPQGAHYDYSVIARTGALGAGIYWQAMRTLALDIALRWDHIHYDYQNALSSGSACESGVNGCRFYRPESQGNHYSEPSLHAGLIYHIRNNFYTFAKLANGYRIPQTSELYRAQSPILAEIDSEKMTSAELGIRTETKNAFFQAALYWMKNKDGIYQNTDRLYLNGVDTDHSGFEYEAGYTYNAFTFEVSGQIAKHRYRNNPLLLGELVYLNGLEVDTAPKHLHQLSARWNISPKIQAGLNAHYTGRYFMDPTNQYEYPGHTLWDLDIRTTLNSSFELHWALLNLFDRQYAERADIANGDVHRYFPGLERRLNVSARYKF